MDKISPKLKAKWEKMLAKDGLEDIEDKSGNLRKSHDHYVTSRMALHKTLGPRSATELELTRIRATEQYYIMAEHFYNLYKHFNRRERAVWELHYQGDTVRDISSKLLKRRFRAMKRMSVLYIIRALEAVMLSDDWDLLPPKGIRKKR